MPTFLVPAYFADNVAEADAIFRYATLGVYLPRVRPAHFARHANTAPTHQPSRYRF
jgi:hypothetical protein